MNKPAIRSEGQILPIISLQGAPERTARDLHAACTETGFFVLTGHGIPEMLQQQVFDQARAFFALPEAEKDKVHIRNSTAYRGFSPMRAEGFDTNTSGDQKESFEMARHLPPDHPEVRAGLPQAGSNVFPERPEGFRSVMEDYYARMVAVSQQLMRLFALSLDLEADFFAPCIDDPHGILRLLHYPPQDTDQSGGGCGAHTDYGCFTLLMTDENSGLEIRNLDGAWVAVPPAGSDYIVNIADLMQRWTNDLYRSTPHRVTNLGGRDRYSVPFFFNPNPEAVIASLDRNSEARYPPVKARDYSLQRYRAAYGGA